MSGFVLIGALLVAAALVERERAGRVLLLAVAAGILASALVYRPFAVDFWREIFPGLRATGRAAVDDRGASPWTPLARVPLFYGWAWPVLAVIGLARIVRHVRPPDARWFHAYALAFVLLLVLRAVAGVVLRDLKDALFVAPLFTLLATCALLDLAGHGRAGRWAAWGIGVGLALHGLAIYWTYATPRLALVAPG